MTTRSVLTRRNILVTGATGLTMPYVWSRPARAAGQVVVRNPGGAYGDTQKKYVYDPFTKETGIEVVVVASTDGQDAGDGEVRQYRARCC